MSDKQLIEMIAQGHAQRIAQDRQQQQIMAAYDQWKQQQQIMAEFDAWKASQPQAQPAQSVQEIPSIKTAQPQRDLQAEAREYFANVRKERREQEAEAKRLKEQQLKATLNDYAKQQQEENELVSISANKRKEPKVGQRPEPIDFSSPVAARGLDESTLKGGEKWKQSVNDTLNVLNSKEMKNINRYQKLVNVNEEKAAKEAKKEMSNINNGINQIDLSKYNLPSESGITEQEQKAFDDYTKALKWSDPNYQMTKEEQQEARRIASEGKQALAEKYPVENKADFGKLYERMSPEDQAKYRTYDDLSLKSDPFSVASIGAADKAVNMLGGALDTVSFFHPEARRAAKDYKELQKKWNEAKEATRTEEIAKSATPLAENVPLLGEITPYGVGQAATQIGAYALTNDVFDEIGAAVLGKKLGKLGGFIGNQIGQNAQDIALDTIPRYQELKAQGKSDEEIRDILIQEGIWNGVGNLTLGALGEIPGLWKSAKNSSAARKAADEAFRQNVLAGKDNLARLADEQIPVFKDTDNLIKNSLDNVNTSVYDEGVKNVDANNGGIDYGTDINRTGNPENTRVGESKTILPEDSGQSTGTGPFGHGDSSVTGRAVVNSQARQAMSEAGVNDVKLRDYSNDYKAYSDALSEARKANSHGAFVDPQSVEELQQNNAKAFMSDNGGCGVAVKDNGNIVGVFKNSSKYEDPLEAVGAANDELLTARLNGGDRLDCYCVTAADKNLVNMYSPAGFEPTHKVRYERGINPEMDAWCDNDIKKWVASGHKEEDYVYPDIVFMKVRDGESVEDTLRLLKEDKIPTYDEYLAQMPYTEARDGLSAYEVAEMERNSLIDEAPKQGAFFDGDSSESINPIEKGSGEEKISKYRTNSMNKLGSVNEQNAPSSDYGYRVFSVEEQKAAGQEKWGNNPDAVRDLLNQDSWDEIDARYAQDRWTELMEAGEVEEANKLARRMSYELREGGRLVQTAAEMDDIASQLNTARKMINSRVDKMGGVGTSEALDNFASKVEKNLDNIDLSTKEGKDEAAKVMAEMMDKDMKTYAPTNKAMTSKQFKKSNKIVSDIRNGKLKTKEDIINEVYRQNGSVPINAEDQKKIYDLLNKAQDLEDGSREQEKVLAHAAKLATKGVPTTLGEKMRGVLYMNMLGNFKTAVSRNAFGNLGFQALEQARSPIAAGVDWAVSKATGKHSTLGWNKEKFKAYGQGFVKGAKEQAEDFASGLNTGRSGGLGWAEALKNNKGTFNYRGDAKVLQGLSDIANKAEFYVENAMKFGDRPFFEANYQQRKTEIYQLLNRYGKENVAGFSAIPDSKLEDTIDMVASVHAADSVFQKQGKISKGLTDLRNGLGEVSEGTIGVDLLSTAASPFTLTPGNMLEKAVEYSPFGAVKNAVETAKELRQGKFNQRRFVDEASRTLTGIPILAATYGLAKKGVINGGYSDDYDEKAAQQEDGFIEYGLNLPNGKTYDTSDIPVVGPFMQAGAAVAEDGVNAKSLLQGASAITAGSTMQGLRRAFGADNGFGSTSSVENLIDTIKSSGTQLVPSLLRQTAQTTDAYKRDLGEYGTNEYYLNAIKNSVPGLRQTLPVKTDVEGKPILQNQGRNIGSKILENYLLPMNVSEYNPSPLNAEASRLLDTTDSAIAFVPKAKRSDLRDWDEKAGMEYSEEQFRTYKEELGKLNSELGNALIQSDFYANLDDKDKAKKLQAVYSAMKAVAKKNATGIDTDDTIANAYINSDGNIESVINHIQGKDLVKGSGLSTSNKAAKQAQELANNGDIEGAQEVIDQKLSMNEALEAHGYDKNSETYQRIYNDYGGEAGLNDLDTLGSVSAFYSYQGAKDEAKSLKTMKIPSIEDYAKTYSKIDSYGNKNGSVTQKEMASYLNAGNYTLEQATDLAILYGDWDKAPHIIKSGKNKGKWGF